MVFIAEITSEKKIVGWYTTTTPNGEFITDNSSLINDFYSSECDNPVHVVIDTTLSGDKINVRGFTSKNLVVGQESVGNTFQEISVKVEMSDAEVTCLHHMINGPAAAIVSKKQGRSEIKVIEAVNEQQRWGKTEVITSIPSDQENFVGSSENLLKVISELRSYVDGVVDGKIAPSREIGIKLAETLNSLQANSSLQATTQGKVQDMLMVSFLSSLTHAQTQISEKLNQIL